MFVALFISILAVLALGLYYLLCRIRAIVLRGKNPDEQPKKTRVVSWCIAGVFILGMVISCVIKPYFFVLIWLHLILFWALFEMLVSLTELLVRKWTKKHPEKLSTEGMSKEEIRKAKRARKFALSKTPYWVTGVAAILVTATYMSISYYLAHKVYRTEYKISTEKQVSALRIALIADSHVGSCFDGEGFAEHLKKIQENDPDLLVISGDYVDDDTTRENMVRSCAALGEFKSTYGVFYVPGNHDRGYSNYRDFTYDDLLAELKKNQVHVLEDKVEELNDSFYVVGRKDRSMKRVPVEQLVAPLDPSKFAIVLDHQPNDYKAEAAAGCDLVLSGHTHGGQMIPIGPIGELIGVNDATYGLEKREETVFIVTSGIADWAIPFKSGTVSEYCIIDIEGI